MTFLYLFEINNFITFALEPKLTLQNHSLLIHYSLKYARSMQSKYNNRIFKINYYPITHALDAAYNALKSAKDFLKYIFSLPHLN